MPTEADFLAAIAAAPEDATTKLVFADWLEDAGDPRAELVRRVVRYAELSDAAGPFARAVVAPALEAQAGWLAPLAAWGRVGPARRGLLRFTLRTGVRVGDLDLGDPLWGWVGELEMEGMAAAVEVGRLALGLARPALWVVARAGSWRGEAPPPGAAHADWPRPLRALDLRGLAVDLPRFGVEMITAAPALRGLRELHFGPLEADARAALFAAAPGLGLEALGIEDGHPPTADELAGLGAAPWFGRLRRLALPLGELRGPDLAPLFADGPLGRLEELRLAGGRLDGAAVRALVDGPARRSLRVLHLDSRALDADAVRVLAGCPHLHGLRELTVWGLPSVALPLAPLAGGPWPELVALTVSTSDLGPGARRALLDGPVLPRLTYLGLHARFVPDGLAREVAASPAVANLSALDLRHLRLADGDLRHLIASPHLSPRCTVLVGGVGVAPATAAAFRERFPNGTLRA